MQITILGKTIEVPDGDDRPREYKCPKCRDKEYIFYTDENGYEFADPCDCLRRKWTLARFERSGLGELAKRSTFKTRKTRRAGSLSEDRPEAERRTSARRSV